MTLILPGGEHPSSQQSTDICVDECGSKCCRTPGFYLPLKPEEEQLFEGHPIRTSVRVRKNDIDAVGGVLRGRFISFQDTGGRCPHLDTKGMCGIYETRPTCCRRFPEEPTPGCLLWPAVWNGALTPLPSPTLQDELPLEIFNRGAKSSKT